MLHDEPVDARLKRLVSLLIGAALLIAALVSVVLTYSIAKFIFTNWVQEPAPVPMFIGISAPPPLARVRQDEQGSYAVQGEPLTIRISLPHGVTQRAPEVYVGADQLTIGALRREGPERPDWLANLPTHTPGSYRVRVRATPDRRGTGLLPGEATFGYTVRPSQLSQSRLEVSGPITAARAPLTLRVTAREAGTYLLRLSFQATPDRLIPAARRVSLSAGVNALPLNLTAADVAARPGDDPAGVGQALPLSKATLQSVRPDADEITVLVEPWPAGAGLLRRYGPPRPDGP